MTKSRREKSKVIIRILLVLFILLAFLQESPAISFGLPSEGPNRSVSITTDYTIYEWWLLDWKTSNLICQIYTESEALPDYSEVLHYCGSAIQKRWINTKPCVYEGDMSSPQDCPGLYMHLVHTTPSKREVEIKLPTPEVWVSISGCEKTAQKNHCSQVPYLRLQATEPLPNEQIIQIVGRINGVGFTCPGALCDLPLSPSGMNGSLVEFWAESSYGDASPIYTAQVRVIPWGDFANPDEVSTDKPTYYVDVLSSQWLGEGASTCSTIWQAFLPVDGPPSWLRTPQIAEEMTSINDYFLLAGLLIKQGLVDASTCPGGGLEENGAANPCGMDLARPFVKEWQNQFDSEIIRVANQTGVPAQMMKNIFSRESQFWPGIYNRVYEAGLGHLSEQGADTVLLWNPSFFSQFCPLILSEETCQRGFGNLDPDKQALLRGALVQQVNAQCPDCPVGIDLTQANFSISVFARSLLANCEQVGQIVFNSTGRQAGQVASYEDLWKFTLVNYHAGPGCLGNALQRTIGYNQRLSWENVYPNLEEGCKTGFDYVQDVSAMPASGEPGIGDLLSTPEPAPYLPTPTYPPTPWPTRTPTRSSPSPTRTPTRSSPNPTATPGTYP
ncbi:MAG: hypothetical protein GX853_04455 [Chloroflexi bacterium]|jgi:hypothetical protein|nr:hypothetical protein [Chloroflexota bacterium]